MDTELRKRMEMLFQGTTSTLYETDPEWVEIVANFSQKETVSVSRLTEKEQMLCILSALLGCQGMGEFQHILHEALNRGIEPVAIKELLYQATAYLGIGRVYDFLTMTNQIMVQHGVVLPLPSQGTTEEKTRFEEGLEKQVSLFGENMKDLPAAETSTAGWQITVLEIITQETD